MKLKILGLALSAMALMAVGAGTVSATTLEIKGKNVELPQTITGSLDPESTALLSSTSGSLSNTCKESHAHGTANVKTIGEGGLSIITGPLSSLSFKKCDPEGVTVHKPGRLFVVWTSATKGDVFSEEAEVTVPTTAGITANCKTSTGTTIGELTGVTEGHATLHAKAVFNCGFLLPSATWTGEYIVTSPTHLGVTS